MNQEKKEEVSEQSWGGFCCYWRQRSKSGFDIRHPKGKGEVETVKGETNGTEGLDFDRRFSSNRKKTKDTN